MSLHDEPTTPDMSLLSSFKKLKNMAEDHPDALWTPAIIKHQKEREKQ